MITSGVRNIIQFSCFLLLLNIICAVYVVPREHRYPFVYNKERSADSGYRYAWFTREIHDDPDATDNVNVFEDEEQQQQLPPEDFNRLKALKSIFKRPYKDEDDTVVQ
ncbi:unnamed protein product [Adineta ricciae]|uniref:Uncharacterized protein n=1 Tax=Adineta ricciae TaxID=249248 RepID=A0A814ACW2_ADIRI|nr:unnamed protein product [Adineta ricciae]CAF0912999.1 unnamed protein product [Adineta ricciae]